MKNRHIIVLALALLLFAAPLSAQEFSALCVGINDYENDDYDRLYAVDDADDIGDALVNRLGWESDSVLVRTGEYAAYQYIHLSLKKYAKRTTNTTLFSFSGYGESNLPYIEGLVAEDGVWIMASDLNGYFDEGSSSYDKFAFIIDAPNSGFLAYDMNDGVILTACSPLLYSTE